MSGHSAERQQGLLVIYAATLALAVRVAAVFVLADPHTAYYEYMLIARNLLGGLGYSYNDDGLMPMQPTSLFPPLYVYFCALFMNLSPANFLPLYLAQAVVGASGVIPAFLLGRKWFDERTGLIFAALYALYPEMIVLVTRPVPEFALIVIALWLIYFYARMRERLRASLPVGRSVLGLGIVGGAALLVRESAAVILAAIFVSLILAERNRRRTLMRVILPAAAVMLIVLLPWMARNAIVQQKFIPLRTGFGLNLWVGNNPYSAGTARKIDGEKVRFTLPPEYAETFLNHLPDDEQDRDDTYFREAMRFIRETPADYLRLCANRLMYMLWFDPTHPLTGQVVYRWSYILLWIVAVPGAVMAVRRRWLDPVLPLTFLGFFALYVPIMVLPRYREVPVVILLLLAAFAVGQIRLSRKAVL
ncbi:MAG: glycosyltransferase family 39 protein [bacterium]|nr:glycosyltransferase family 39 protein [bacterium]